MKATIRYLATICKDPGANAGAYLDEGAMQEIGRSPEGDVSLTDGYYNLSLFRQRASLIELRKDFGPHHIGIDVPSIAQVLAKYRELVPGGVVVREPDGTQYGDVRIFDPECNPISLSESGFGVGEARTPRMRVNVGIQALQPQRSGDFMTALFGLREQALPEAMLAVAQLLPERPQFNCLMGDGTTNLAFHAYYGARDDDGYAIHERHAGTEDGFVERRFGNHTFGLLRNA